uniref:Elongation factor 1 beta n=1 Tax=Bursaphelenchus xylophilus TaxID=6326 RepID=D1MBQ1_BURXY|nr:elongation factor 1 beta [Bursaphelenchus xylophilus]
MAAITDASNTKQVAELNTKLQQFAYVEGYEPSAADAATFAVFKKAPTQPVAVARWYRNIASFTEAERKAWSSGAGTSAEAAPAAKDDDFDLFGSDEEEDDAEKERIKQERLKAYAEKKSKKPGPIAKSNIIYDIKPWDDTIDLDSLVKKIKSEVTMDGLVWGAHKILPIAYGVNKIQLMCVVEDEKVSSDDLEERITGYEDEVQSVDVVAFNKV